MLSRRIATVRDHLSETTSAIGMLPAEAVPAPRGRWWIPAVIAAVLIVGAVAVWRVGRVDDWKSPLAGARFTRLTDWEGSELDAAMLVGLTDEDYAAQGPRRTAVTKGVDFIHRGIRFQVVGQLGE